MHVHERARGRLTREREREKGRVERRRSGSGFFFPCGKKTLSVEERWVEGQMEGCDGGFGDRKEGKCSSKIGQK